MSVDALVLPSVPPSTILVVDDSATNVQVLVRTSRHPCRSSKRSPVEADAFAEGQKADDDQTLVVDCN